MTNKDIEQILISNFYNEDMSLDEVDKITDMVIREVIKIKTNRHFFDKEVK